MNTLKQTEINPNPEEHLVDPASAEHANYAVVRPVGETLDADQIQRELTDYVKSLELGGKFDVPFSERMALGDAEVDPSMLFAEEEAIPSAALELTKFCAHLASSLGFDDTATLSIGLQGDKYSSYSNINEIPHRDGARGEVDSQTASVRFVYPIGRPGSLIFPGIQEDGTPGVDAVSEEKGWHVERISPDPGDPGLPSRFLPKGDTEIITSVDDLPTDSQATQIIPGNLLVFDMTNSPWHAAPKPTVDGAVFTVDVRQATP